MIFASGRLFLMMGIKAVTGGQLCHRFGGERAHIVDHRSRSCRHPEHRPSRRSRLAHQHVMTVWGAEGLTILLRPQFKPLLILVVHLHPLLRNTLQDVVDLSLGDVEHCWMSFGYIPLDVEAHQSPETDEGVTHQCNTSTLRRGREKGDGSLLLLEVIRQSHEPVPELGVSMSWRYVEKARGKRSTSGLVVSLYWVILQRWTCSSQST